MEYDRKLSYCHASFAKVVYFRLWSTFLRWSQSFASYRWIRFYQEPLYMVLPPPQGYPSTWWADLLNFAVRMRTGLSTCMAVLRKQKLVILDTRLILLYAILSWLQATLWNKGWRSNMNCQGKVAIISWEHCIESVLIEKQKEKERKEGRGRTVIKEKLVSVANR